MVLILDEYEVGQEVKADIFAEGEIVDVTGISKGKGFQGAIKRHGQSRGPMSHGSRYHRAQVQWVLLLQTVYSKVKNSWTYGWRTSYCSKLSNC